MLADGEAEHAVEIQFPDQPVDGRLAVVAGNFGEDQAGAVALVAAAEADLAGEQFPGSIYGHGGGLR